MKFLIKNIKYIESFSKPRYDSGDVSWRFTVKNDLVARFQYVIGPVIAVSLLVYFIYHLIQGERGLLAWGRLKQQVTIAEQKLQAVKTEQQALEQRVHLMRPDSLDTDMLEEQAKEKLNFVRKDEIIIKDDELGG